MNRLACITTLLVMAGTAMALGVGPSDMSYSGVLRGGYSEHGLHITNTNSEEALIRIEKEGIASWMRIFARERPFIETLEFVAGPGETVTLVAAMLPPSDSEVRNYEGRLTVYSSSSHGGAAGSGLGVDTAVAVTVRLALTGQQTVDYRVEGISIRDAEAGLPIQLTLSGENRGNVRVAPSLHVAIFDAERKPLRTLDLQAAEILPTTRAVQTFNITNDLATGQYWANVTVSAAGAAVYSSVVTFDVAEPGSLRVKGELVRVDTGTWVELGEPSKVSAIFMNTGELDVSAKFRGEVLLDGRLMQVLESEEILVPAGQEAQLPVFFTPQKEGRYVVKGAVYYSKKVTEEKEGVINVLPSRFGMSDIIAGGAVYAAFVLAIAFIYVRSRSGGGYRNIEKRQEKIGRRLDRLIEKSELLKDGRDRKD